MRARALLLTMSGALLVSALQVYRTSREDHMLQDGLPGYREYCQQVRWRLLPGVW